MEIKKYGLQEKAAELRIQPSERIWNRLEQRLDQDRDKIKISTVYKWIGIAAGILVVLSVSFLLPIKNSARQPFVIQDLEPVPEASLASYQYASQLNEIYEQKTWVNFSEGNRKRLKPTPDDGSTLSNKGKNL